MWQNLSVENVGNMVLSEWLAELKDKKTNASFIAPSFLYKCGTSANVLAQLRGKLMSRTYLLKGSSEENVHAP